ncbi:hypothetical protein R1sor_016158 [Riccia sorocarpa]|uniref:Uncharacterized protein n=1 Tax=Riccia sorocarpa TaxID=122646 RepID=A0ABD3HHC9_9MARC
MENKANRTESGSRQYRERGNSPGYKGGFRRGDLFGSQSPTHSPSSPRMRVNIAFEPDPDPNIRGGTEIQEHLALQSGDHVVNQDHDGNPDLECTGGHAQGTKEDDEDMSWHESEQEFSANEEKDPRLSELDKKRTHDEAYMANRSSHKKKFQGRSQSYLTHMHQVSQETKLTE